MDKYKGTIKGNKYSARDSIHAGGTFQKLSKESGHS